MEDFKERLSKTGLSQITIKGYLNEANKYLLDDEDDLDRWNEEKMMVAYIEAHRDTLSRRNELAKAVIKWRQLHGLTSELLSKYLTENVAKYKSSLTKKYEGTDSGLPSLESYNEFVDGLFEKKHWKSYIINRLIQLYQVRNMDLDLTVTSDKKAIDTATNWLLVKTNKASATVTYIRNNYKTAGTYGAKEHTMKLKLTDPLYIAIKHVLDSGDGKLIHGLNIGRVVKQATMNLGEGAVFKLMMQHASFKDAKKFGDNRGTDLSTISQHYDLK